MRPALFAILLATTVAAPAYADQVITTQTGKVLVATFASGLYHPWGVAVLPDGRLLVTERSGQLRIIATDGTVSAPLSGVPAVYANGQGGLLDVALHPDFATNGQVYLTFSEGDSNLSGTALYRAQLSGDALVGGAVIWRQAPKVNGDGHYGSRIAFKDGYIFISVGERQKFTPAQDLNQALGKVIRLNYDGSVPPTNPFYKYKNVKTEIYSYGHRNPQGLAVNPVGGAIWESEHGPMGGDELNTIYAKRNYGWPLVSWGDNYDGTPIPKPPTRPDLTDARTYWNPSIATSGINFYKGTLFPKWKNNLFVSALSYQKLVRVIVTGNTVVSREDIPLGHRIRQVITGGDGSLLAITDEDNGLILKLTPTS